MDAEDAFVVKGRTERGRRGILDFVTINNGCVIFGGNLKLLGVGVFPLEAEFRDVVIHGKATGVMVVVSFESDASIQITLPFFSDIIVLFGASRR